MSFVSDLEPYYWVHMTLTGQIDDGALIRSWFLFGLICWQLEIKNTVEIKFQTNNFNFKRSKVTAANWCWSLTRFGTRTDRSWFKMLFYATIEWARKKQWYDSTESSCKGRMVSVLHWLFVGKRLDRAPRLLQAAKTLRAYVECTTALMTI